jgi:hypothetical protein
MKSTEQICFKWHNKKEYINPVNPMISHWRFNEDEEDEARLANQLAVLSEKSGMTVNDLQHIFPAILRMIKNTSAWSI